MNANNLRSKKNRDAACKVIIMYFDLKEKYHKKGFKSVKSFDRWFSKNEGKVRVHDYLKYPEDK